MPDDVWFVGCGRASVSGADAGPPDWSRDWTQDFFLFRAACRTCAGPPRPETPDHG